MQDLTPPQEGPPTQRTATLDRPTGDDLDTTMELDLPRGRAVGLVRLREQTVDSVARARTASVGYARLVGLADVTLISIALLLGYRLRFEAGQGPGTEVPYVLVGTGLLVLWVVLLSGDKAYDDRVLGYGVEEYRRVAWATFKLFGAVAMLAYLFAVPVSRGFLGWTFGLGILLIPAGRSLMRVQLHRQRRRDSGWTRRVLVVGDVPPVLELINQLRRERRCGYQVVGACIPDALVAPLTQHLGGVPVTGSFSTILDSARRAGADTVAVTASTELAGLRLRRLGWQMEGTGINLVLAPTLMDVAGPRIHTRPVAGLPLIHVASPAFDGMGRLIKAAFDRLAAGLALLVISPLLVLIAVLITVDTPGPVIYRQRRVGLDGNHFDVLKFRSMVVDADSRLAELARQNEGQGLLFKMRDDPRVTRVGRVLRRYSLDELPQLINVVRGEMSLVGPRPPLPTEVAKYSKDIARRLLVKPGITGLWQVSGRSDLSWDDSVRLDLYYVENWSFGTDLGILWKTFGAVLGSRGAY